MQVITFTELRKHLKTVMDTAADTHEPVVITRPRGEHMVLLSLDNYESLKETAYLLGHEANAKHLRKSLESIKTGKLLEKKLLEE